MMKRLWNVFYPPPPPEPPKWIPILGEMQKTLQMAEYLPLHSLPMFESNFTQVTNNGTPAFLHNKPNKLTMGVAASLPGLVLPDILLIARPPEGQECSSLILTRMIPLDLARLYVHDLPTWRLKLRLRTGRHYFLALDAPEHELAFLFDCWIRLINMLHGAKLFRAPKNIDNSHLETPLEGTPASTWHFQIQPQDELTVEVAGNTFPSKIFSSQKPKKTKGQPIKHALRSQAVGDSVSLIWSQPQHSEDQLKVTKNKSYLEACSDRPCHEPLIHVSDKASITIQTIFSIISNTITQAHKSDSEEDTVRGGLIETPTKCISRNNTDLAVTVSSNHLDTLLWAQSLEDCMDTESTTLSSLNTSHSPAFYIFPPSPSFTKSKDNARPTGSKKHVTPLSSHKAATVTIKSVKMPFILDQSNTVPAEPAPAQMASAPPTLSRKTSAAPWPRWESSTSPSHFSKSQPSVSQKTPTIPDHPQKP